VGRILEGEMLPSEWATIDIDFGESKKHLYSPDSSSIEFHATYDKAFAAARRGLEEGSKMVAILMVNRIVKWKGEVEEIK
jgi:hypothetical protein